MVLVMARPVQIAGSRFPYARKVVPVALRGILGRSEFKRPLHGETPGEIRRQHAEALAGWEAEIATARAKLRGTFRTLTGREIEAICGDWYKAEMAEHGDSPGDAEQWGDWVHRLADEVEGEGEDTVYIPKPRALAEAEALLTSRGIVADTATIARVAASLRLTKMKFCGAMARLANGDWSPDPNLPKFPTLGPKVISPAPAPTMTFATLVAAWAAETKPPRKTREKWDAAFRGLAGVIGHDDVKRVTVNEVRAWKERRAAQGLSNKTVADGIAVYRATWNWGAKNGLLPRDNPFANMAPKVQKRGPAARDGYSDEQAAMVLKAARTETGWKRWLPWVLAFTGCRIEEVAEARKRDVRQECGVWILDVVPTAHRSLKTTQSQRMVPLHPALVAEGFLAYAQGLPAGPLFPDLAPGRYGSRGSKATKEHSRWLRKRTGITDRRIAPAHSWRHRMEDALRRARVPPEAADAITGHDNPRNSGAGYGRGFRAMPDETMKELSRVPSPLALAGGVATADLTSVPEANATPTAKTPLSRTGGRRTRSRAGKVKEATGHIITVKRR